MRIAVLDMNNPARNWWAVVLRGVVAVLFGLATMNTTGI